MNADWEILKIDSGGVTKPKKAYEDQIHSVVNLFYM